MFLKKQYIYILHVFDRTERCPYDRNVLFLLFDTFCMYFILMAIVTFVFYSLGLLVRTVKESKNILSKYFIFRN